MATTGQDKGETKRGEQAQPPTATRSAQRATALTRAPQQRWPFSPFSVFRRMFEDMERLMDTAGVGPGMQGAPEPAPMGFAWVPPIDITQRDGKLVVRADLPGLAPDEVRVAILDDAIVIEGERHAELEQQEGDLIRAERTHGRFRRVIPLPPDADADTAEARFVNGVLEVSVKAAGAERRGRQLEIKGASPGSH